MCVIIVCTTCILLTHVSGSAYVFSLGPVCTVLYYYYIIIKMHSIVYVNDYDVVYISVQVCVWGVSIYDCACHLYITCCMCVQY